VLLPVESVLEGTWGGGEPVPEEFADFELMREMHWTFEQLQATPPYVQAFCSDFISMTRQAEHAAQEKANRGR
jgi:hypothetical protein